uniref:60S ribosomal protein L32 n=1 Tax=Rhizophora mucronata TaxID=61149 RepID=A0A2P2P456_RHIMU
MAVPLPSKTIAKKRVKKFKRPQSDRKLAVKVYPSSQSPFFLNVIGRACVGECGNVLLL